LNEHELATPSLRAAQAAGNTGRFRRLEAGRRGWQRDGRQTAADVAAADGGGSAVIIGLDPGRVDDTVQTLAKDGEASGITADLADRMQVERVCQQLAGEHADATLLVNAAGFFIPKPFLEHDGAGATEPRPLSAIMPGSRRQPLHKLPGATGRTAIVTSGRRAPPERPCPSVTRDCQPCSWPVDTLSAGLG
jgi:hypothetical protein